MKICIATTDLMGPIKNGGVGTACSILAQTLSKRFGDIDILFANFQMHSQSDQYLIWKNEFAYLGIRLLPFELPKYKLEHPYLFTCMAYLTYQNLKKSAYDIILFPEMHGLAHYCLWAKKMGLAFKNTKLVVMYHGPTEWHHLYNESIPTNVSDLVLYHIEKTSCQMADHVIYGTQHSMEVAEQLGYYPTTADRATSILMYPFIQNPNVNALPRSAAKIKEICFFGRVEFRKGIKDFLQSLVILEDFLLKHKIKVTILGTMGYVDSVSADVYLKNWASKNSIELNIIPDFTQSDAISYLHSNNCLTILSSLEETMGYTLIECIINQIPFILSDISPYQEILHHFSVSSETRFFESANSKSLAQVLKAALQNNKLSTQYSFSIKQLDSKWIHKIESFRTTIKIHKETKINSKLAICIVYKDRPEYLKQLIDSLTPIKNLIGQILIFDNGSKLTSSVKILTKLKRDKTVTVISSATNRGPSYARNRMAEKSTSETLLFIDDDNILDPFVFEKIYRGLPADWEVVVTPLKTFFDEKLFFELDFSSPGLSTLLMDQIVDSHRFPIGSDLSFNVLDNAIGDANFLIKKSHFDKIGGFEENLNYGEDQALLIKSHILKGNYAIAPESFIFYRLHDKNLSKSAGPKNSNLTKLMNAITQHTNIPEISKYLLMTVAWNFEKSRHGSHPYNLMQRQYSEKKPKAKINVLNILNKHHFIENFIVVDLRKTFSVKKSKRNSIQVPSRMLKISNINIEIFSPQEGVISVNNSLVKISSGINNLNLTSTQMSGEKISFESKRIERIYILKSWIN